MWLTSHQPILRTLFRFGFASGMLFLNSPIRGCYTKGLTMSRKDFELIALTLRNANEVVDEEALKALAVMFADNLRLTNPRFDYMRFIRACKAVA